MDDSSISEPIDEGQEHWTRTLDRISPRRQTARWGSWSIHFLRRNPRNDVDFRPKIEATPISFFHRVRATVNPIQSSHHACFRSSCVPVSALGRNRYWASLHYCVKPLQPHLPCPVASEAHKDGSIPLETCGGGSS